MRKIVVLVLVLFIANSAFAVVKTKGRKAPPKKQPESFHLGWYVAPVVKFGEVRDDLRTLVGLRAGLQLDRVFYVGVAGYGMPLRTTDPYWDHRYFHDSHWELGYGGLELGIINGSPRSGQLSLGLLVGGGEINGDRRYYRHYDGFFIMEPQFDFLLNLSRHVRLGFGAGYRFVDGLESLYYTESDLSGPTFNISVAVGRF